MISAVSLTRVFVNDQQVALEFYTEKLGLQKIQDEPYDEGTRWITVSPVGAKTRILLEKAEQDHEKTQVGRSDEGPVMVLGTNDVLAAYEELRKRGVRFTGEPYRSRGASGWCSWTRTGPPYTYSRRSQRSATRSATSSLKRSFPCRTGELCRTPLLGTWVNKGRVTLQERARLT